MPLSVLAQLSSSASCEIGFFFLIFSLPHAVLVSFQVNMENSTTLCLTGTKPIALANSYVCNRGFFCPNNTEKAVPQYCAPTTECQLVRLQSGENTCDRPQGIYEPIVCSKGDYCPSPGSTKYPCPAKYYCPLGTETPLKCGTFSICPKGSSREFNVSGFLVAFIADIMLLVIIFAPVYLASRKVMARRSRDKSGDDELTTDNDSLLNSPDETKQMKSRSQGVSLEYKQLTFEVGKPRRALVSSVSGTMSGGTLCGLLGPSGAGKTTLMHLLMGKLLPTNGEMKLNGLPAAPSQSKKLVGYVPADDVLSPYLTVRENILHSSRVRGPRAWSDQQHNDLTEEIMYSLGILHIEHQYVGDSLASSISTGQRKRVSIAVELVARPRILFLDEPTSGLDSTTAMSLTRLLKKISGTGVTVICILHQPREEIFDTLDHVTLLTEGKQLYQGPPREAVSYFQEHGYEIAKGSNPADVLLDIAAGKQRSVCPYIGTSNTVERLAQMWERQCCVQKEALHHSKEARLLVDVQIRVPPLSASDTAARGASWARQMKYCCVRAMKQQFRQPTSLLLEIAVGGVAGLLIGLGLYPNKGTHFQGVYLPPFQPLSSAVDYTTVPKIGEMIALATALAAAAPGVSVFGEEKPLYWREAAAGHRRSAYFAGKIIATVPRMALSALHFASFYAILATPSINFWMLYTMILLYFYCVYGLASLVSVAARRENGTLLAMILCLIIGAFGGYAPMLSTIKSWHLEWLWRMCPGTWLTEAYFDQTLSKTSYLYDVHAAAAWSGFRLGQTPLDMSMIFVIGTFYRALTFGGLISFDRARQR